jgi:putative ABC transport system permease protein
MFRNYFKIALRNLRRSKAFTAINVAGLALGIATCLLIVLYIQYEMSYDRWNSKSDRIVRVSIRGKMQVGELNEASIMPPVAATLQKDFPEIEEATRIMKGGSPRITYGEKTFKEDALAFADSNFFRVFSIPLIKGDPQTALVQPFSVVVSSAVAKRYFGNEDPIGKILQFKDQKAAATVTGVFREIPDNTQFHFGLLVSMSSNPDARSDSWLNGNFYTYLVLPKQYDYKKLDAKLPQEIDKYVGPQLKKGMGITIEEFRKNGNSINLYLEPLTGIHLHSATTNDFEPHGNVQYIYIFGVVALFMLLIACINFMNLSTAGASKRAREVGVRKVMGSVKSQLIYQFLLESLLLTTIALILGLVIVWMVLPYFNQLVGKQLMLDLTTNPLILPGLVLFGLLTGLLAGSYPAFFLSSFNPVTVLKGKLSSGRQISGIRSGLVVFQFCISIALMIGTLVVYKQLSYIHHKNLGYNKEQVLVVEQAWWLKDNRDQFLRSLREDPRITGVSASGYLPAGPTNNNNFFTYSDGNTSQMIKGVQYVVDVNYIPTLGMQMAEGRNFSKEYPSDSSGIIINQAAVRSYGWKNSPIGHTIVHREDNVTTAYHVVGVVKDFNFRSLHEQITPLAMTLGPDWNNIIVRTNTKDMAGLLNAVQRDWDGATKESGFTFSFLDQRYDNTYKAEQNIGIILGIFAGLTIFVACLGLFGLATFTAAQRFKEIGIRKVLGADVKGLIALLSRDFLKLVGIALVIAAPIAWWVMNWWLQDFSYRTSISWWIFGAAAFLSLLVALVTISSQAIRAATANPVKSLRSE